MPKGSSEKIGLIFHLTLVVVGRGQVHITFTAHHVDPVDSTTELCSSTFLTMEKYDIGQFCL